MGMKKLIILIIGAAICFSATAQENQVSKKRQWNKNEKADKEMLIEKRCKKIADKLMLDEATAAKFKDVYKAYLSELKQSFDLKKSAEQNNKELSDADIDNNVKNGFAKSRKAIDVREKYYSEFRKFLTPKQARTALNMRDGNKKHKEFRKPDDNQRQQLKKRLDFNHDKQRVNDTNLQSGENS
jgi:hypothetical protein